MEIEKTPIYREILDVFRTNDKKTNVGWTATIHLDDIGTVYTPLQVSSVNIKRDYVDGYADEMSITLSIPLGKYARKVYPARDNLQITMYRAPLLEGTTELDFDAEVESERYSAIIIESGPAMTELQGQETNDEWALDLTQILEINFQLFNKSIEKIRMSTTGGIFRKTKVDDYLTTMITNATNVKVDDKRSVEGVDIVDPKNNKPIEQLVVTQGTKLIDLPHYVQKKYGVYASGIGSFIQNKHWFIYPLYDTTRFEKTERTLTIFILPKRKFPEIERTYRKKGDALLILSTAETSFSNDNTINYLNEGNGVRSVDSSKMMDGFGKTKGNKTVLPRGKNNSEFIAEKKQDGVNNAPMSKNRISSNPFEQFSQLASRKGGLFKVIWENSNPTYLEPGMVTKIVYFDEEEMKEAYGTVCAATHISTKAGDFTSKKHICNSQLYLFVNLKPPES